jgi:hypothetical protein
MNERLRHIGLILAGSTGVITEVLQVAADRVTVLTDHAAALSDSPIMPLLPPWARSAIVILSAAALLKAQTSKARKAKAKPDKSA